MCASSTPAQAHRATDKLTRSMVSFTFVLLLLLFKPFAIIDRIKHIERENTVTHFLYIVFNAFIREFCNYHSSCCVTSIIILFLFIIPHQSSSLRLLLLVVVVFLVPRLRLCWAVLFIFFGGGTVMMLVWFFGRQKKPSWVVRKNKDRRAGK